MKVKQVIVLRKKYVTPQGKTFQVRKGKLISQGAHASLAILTNNLIGHPFKWHKFPFKLVRFLYIFFFHKPFRIWHTGSFTKICVSVDSEQELKKIYYLAQKKGLLCSIIKDAGITEFKGVPTYTAVAIGPDEVSKIDKITGGSSLL